MLKRSLALGALFLVGCLDLPDDAAPPDTEAASDIGVCGANLDPISGVTCRYGPGGVAVPGTGSQRHAVIETGPDGLDYAVCYVEIECRVYGQGMNGYRGCESIIGTGCPPITMTRSHRSAFLLPAGAHPTEEELAAYCQFDVPAQSVCEHIDWTYVEQAEDLCCVRREPIVQPVPSTAVAP